MIDKEIPNQLKRDSVKNIFVNQCLSRDSTEYQNNGTLADKQVHLDKEVPLFDAF
jgi:hypothetical protein